MNVALRPWTTEQFLEWEARQELRHEFDGVRPMARAGGKAAHAAIQRNLITALGNALRDKPCQPYGIEFKIALADHSIRYPDAFVNCTPIPPAATVVYDPVVVFEILSDSSAKTDLFIKNAEYRGTPSIQRYVVLQQTEASATVFARKGEDWVMMPPAGPAVTLSMPEIGTTIEMAEIYRRVTFEQAADDPSPDTGTA